MGTMAPYLAMMGIQAGGSLLSAMFAPEDQKINSFAGQPGLDPRDAMTDSKKMITDLGRMFSAYADMPVSLPSSTVQGLPTITGGGLPMPIGVTGKDPARANPGLLTKRWNDNPAGDSVHREIVNWPREGPRRDWPDTFPPDGDSPRTGGISGVARRPRGTDLMGGNATPMANPAAGDDTDKAMAAVDLLLQGMMGGAGNTGQKPPMDLMGPLKGMG